MIVAEKQRAMRLSNKRLQQSIARLIKALEKELAGLDADIDVAVRGSPAWREKGDLLISVPGVGKSTARTLLAMATFITMPNLMRRRCSFSLPVPLGSENL